MTVIFVSTKTQIQTENYQSCVCICRAMNYGDTADVTWRRLATRSSIQTEPCSGTLSDVVKYFLYFSALHIFYNLAKLQWSHCHCNWMKLVSFCIDSVERQLTWDKWSQHDTWSQMEIEWTILKSFFRDIKMQRSMSGSRWDGPKADHSKPLSGATLASHTIHQEQLPNSAINVTACTHTAQWRKALQ